MERMRDQSKMRYQMTECPNIAKWQHLLHIQQHDFHSCASSWRTCPWKEVSPQPCWGHACQQKTSPWQETRVENGWNPRETQQCLLLLSTELLSLNFPAAALSCFPIRNWRREGPVGHPAHSSLGLWCFLPTVSQQFCPVSFPGSRLRSWALGDSFLYSAVTEIQGIPLLAKQILSPCDPVHPFSSSALVFVELRSPLVRNERYKHWHWSL